MRTVLLSIVGLGTVGRWVADAVARHEPWLRQAHDVHVRIVGAATRHGGFVYRAAGLDLAGVRARAEARRSFADLPDVQCWPTALEGLAATLDRDHSSDARATAMPPLCVVAETSNTNPRDPEPALSHIRLALERGAHVVTSSKGACAAAAVELRATAQANGVQCRMESTVMSGTPALSTITEGLAGASVTAVRGILNGTVNYILTRMAEGLSYATALAEAQAVGFAEPDPADDVEGHDAVAKTRILAAVAFGRQLGEAEVRRAGIADLTTADVERAMRSGQRVRHVATITRNADSSLTAAVEPVALPDADALARVDGVLNALQVETDVVRRVLVVGPGAGIEQAGQGVFADLIAVIAHSRRASPRSIARS